MTLLEIKLMANETYRIETYGEGATKMPFSVQKAQTQTSLGRLPNMLF
jgi:hypothetical protein